MARAAGLKSIVILFAWDEIIKVIEMEWANWRCCKEIMQGAMIRMMTMREEKLERGWECGQVSLELVWGAAWLDAGAGHRELARLNAVQLEPMRSIIQKRIISAYSIDLFCDALFANLLTWPFTET